MLEEQNNSPYAPDHLNMRQQFTVAAVSIGTGLGAALACHELVTPLAALPAYFTTCAAAAGLVGESMRMGNWNRFRARLQNAGSTLTA